MKRLKFDNLRKSSYFDDITEAQNNNVHVHEVGKTSLRVTLPCGCNKTESPFVARHVRNRRGKLLQSNREEFFEFCKTHKP